MTFDEFRAEMLAYWQSVVDEGLLYKDSYLPLKKLDTLYKKFDNDERPMANQVLSEWVLSEDDRIRFCALHLIREFKIKTVMPELDKLAKRLVSSTEPGAPYELDKVSKILALLGNL